MIAYPIDTDVIAETSGKSQLGAVSPAAAVIVTDSTDN